jgi:hypothetical protein
MTPKKKDEKKESPTPTTTPLLDIQPGDTLSKILKDLKKLRQATQDKPKTD